MRAASRGARARKRMAGVGGCALRHGGLAISRRWASPSLSCLPSWDT
jgi:hypothetical protein